MVQLDDRARGVARLMKFGARVFASPRPGVTEPHCRQQPQTRSLRPTVGNSNLDQDVFYIRLSIFYEYVEVAIVYKETCIEKFKFTLNLDKTPVFRSKLCVEKRGMRILVQINNVRVRRRAVEIEEVFLHK